MVFHYYVAHGFTQLKNRRFSVENINLSRFDSKEIKLKQKKDNLVFWKLFYLFCCCSKENDYLSCENEKQ